MTQHLQHLKPKAYGYLAVKAVNWKEGSKEAIKRYQEHLEPVKSFPSEIEELFAHVCQGTDELTDQSKLRKIRANAETIFGPEHTPEQLAQIKADFASFLEDLEPFFDELAAAN
jgi:hypothetical protein